MMEMQTEMLEKYRYQVDGHACPQLYLRLLGLFAQQDLIPADIEGQQRDDALILNIVQPGLDRRRAEIIAEKMRMITTVRSVTLTDMAA